MRLYKANIKQIRYSCLNYHYAKAVPSVIHGYSVFNDKNQFCGIIGFGQGANQNLGKKYGLVTGQYLELVRVALNGKQESTSQALSIAMKLLKKENTLVKLLISYADNDQNHQGIIYKATNWIFEGETQLDGGTPKFRIKGKVLHGKSVHSKGWKQNIDWIRKNIDPNAELVFTKGKKKFIYWLRK